MKKIARLTVLTALILMLGCAMPALAGVIPPYGEGQIGLRGAILCETLTVREAPSASAAAVKTLKYGDFIIVMKQENGWAQIIRSDAEDAAPDGWVNADYILIDPAWYETDARTVVYAWNNMSAPKVGLLSKNVTLPILMQDGDWVLVSLRGAVGWIHK